MSAAEFRAVVALTLLLVGGCGERGSSPASTPTATPTDAPSATDEGP